MITPAQGMEARQGRGEDSVEDDSPVDKVDAPQSPPQSLEGRGEGLPEEIGKAIQNLQDWATAGGGLVSGAVLETREARTALGATILQHLSAAEGHGGECCDGYEGQIAVLQQVVKDRTAERDEARAELHEALHGEEAEGVLHGLKVMAEARDKAEIEREALRAENAKLRTIISESATAIGNGAGIGTECSLEFMSWLPKEIGGVTGDLRAERDALRAQLEAATSICAHRASVIQILGHHPDMTIAEAYDAAGRAALSQGEETDGS